jgi:hypothetical protein
MSTGHGNHWGCLQKPAEEAIQNFIPATIAKGQLGKPLQREGLWFDREQPSIEKVIPIVMGNKAFGTMVLLVSDSPKKSSVLYSAYPYARKAGKQHLRLTEIRDWGNEIEAVLVCEDKDGMEIAFFNTRYFANRDRYQVGESYDFCIAGVIYAARCTNDETIEITDQERIAEFHSGCSEEPERLPDGTLAPIIIHYAGCLAYVSTSEEYAEDAEFYCVIKKVEEFDIEGIRIFQITPASGDEKVPLPGVIYGAASMFKDGYVPKVGDSIGGGLWTQGFLDEPKEPKVAKRKRQ